MAGWSMVADGSSVDCVKITSKQKNLEPKGFYIDIEPSLIESESQCSKLRCCFVQFLRFFHKETSAHDNFRPLPPMLGDGQSVDLFKLFLAVREKGGYDTVSNNGLWDLVAKDVGLDLSVSSSVKLVYVKYLDALERWLDKAVHGKKAWKSKSSGTGSSLSGYLMELGADFKRFLSGSEKKEEVYPLLEELNSEDGVNVCRNDISMLVESSVRNKCVDEEESMHFGPAKRYADFVEVAKFCDDGELKSTVLDREGDKSSFDVEVVSCLDDVDVTKSVVNSSDFGKVCRDEEVKSAVVMESDGGKNCVDSDKEDVVTLDFGIVEEKEENSSGNEKMKESSSRKRKQESMWQMLSWITGIAKNPCDSVVGSLPEKSKWNSYGNDELWKQVLSYRKAVFLKRYVDSSGEQPCGQKNQKMHPCMYDDHFGSSYSLRERLTCSKKHLLEKVTSQARACLQSCFTGGENDSDKGGMENHDDKRLLQATGSSTTYSVFDYDAEKPIPIGPGFQAEVPGWTDAPSESDSKWLGTRVWPLEKVEHRFLIERDRIGKGRQDSCGCEAPGSIKCVRFHIAEKRCRLKIELGSAFFKWKFDKMGEEVMLSWSEKEQKNFKNIVRLNPPSLDKCFWDQIFKFFPAKSREELVSYYFNVFLLQRRAQQNRFDADNIDSDDDYESESGLVTNRFGHETMKSPSSILHTPNKKQKKSR